MGKPRRSYWQQNTRILSIMLVLWGIISFPVAIFFAEALDSIRLGGFGLGFWMAQQGAIFCYVLMILVYILLMDRLDRRFGVDEQSLHESHRDN